MTNSLNRLTQGLSKYCSTIAIMLQKIEGHALSRLGAHTGEYA
jgi:hypothetical protein